MVSTLTCFTQYIRVLQYIFSLPFPVSEQGNALVSIIRCCFFYHVQLRYIKVKCMIQKPEGNQ